jgi:hypothetical protein
MKIVYVISIIKVMGTEDTCCVVLSTRPIATIPTHKAKGAFDGMLIVTI